MTELLNQTDYPLSYERAVFFGGAMHRAPPFSLEAGHRTYWTSGQGSSGMDIMRGNLSAVIFTVGRPQQESTGSNKGEKAELLLITHLSRLQINPQCIGVRIGAVGTLTGMDEKKLHTLVVDSTASLTTTWQRVEDRASGLEALASFGRDPVRFVLRPLKATGASLGAYMPRTIETDTMLAVPEFEQGVACMAVCQLENRSTLMLHLNRAVFAAGEPRAAVDVTPLPPGGMTAWSCASPPGVKQGFGNEGVLIFSCHCRETDGDAGELAAELALVWRLPYTMSLPAENRVGALLGRPNSFSSTSSLPSVHSIARYRGHAVQRPRLHGVGSSQLIRFDTCTTFVVRTYVVMTHEQLLSLSGSQTNKHLHSTGENVDIQNDDQSTRSCGAKLTLHCRRCLCLLTCSKTLSIYDQVLAQSEC